MVTVIAPSRARRWSALYRAIRVFLGTLLLTTCSTDSVGPAGLVNASLDARSLVNAAADFAIPIDEVVIEVRRVSNNEVVVSRTLNSDQFTSNSTELVISLRLEMETTPEDFTFTATARSGGVDYYSASGTVTAVAFTSVTGPPLTPQYIGPGANAEFITITQNTTLGNGQTATLLTQVVENDQLVTGVPVTFSSSDSSSIIPQQQGLNSALVTAPATGSGTVTITARTPTGLTATGDVSWAPVATQLVLASGNGQTIQPGANAAQPLAVSVLDANNNPVSGVAVDFAVTGGPTGTSVNPTSTISDNGGAASTTLTAGNSNGNITVTATSAGLTGSPITFTATVASTVGQPSVVVANSQTTQNAVVGTAVAAPPSVIVRDGNGVAVPNVTVTFAVTAGGGSLTGASQTTNTSGIATVGSWTVGPAIGANSVTATVTGLTPVTFNATGTAGAPASVTLISGNGQTGATGAALAQPLVVEVRDAGGNLVSGATVTWTPSDGSVAPTSGPTATNGQAQTTWTLGANQLTPTVTAAVAGAGSVTFNATTTFPNPTILLSVTGPSLVGVGLNNTINITLSQPAGVNGATLTLSSDNTNVLTVAPTTVNIGQGQSTGSFTTTGVSAGSTTIRATAPGYDPAALPFGATLQIISMPATLNVPFGQNQNFPVSLAVPAPAGGVTVAIATTDATHVAVVSNTVSIAAGSQVGTATVFGQFPGPATINATAAGYVPAATAATTTALLNIVQGSLSLNASFGTTMTVELRSGAITVPAPSGGLVVTLTAADPGCVAVPATVTIPQGLVNVNAAVNYGGSTTTPCNTQITASAPNITSDVVTANVAVQPPITLNTPGSGTGRLGNGLQDNAGASLASTPTSPLTVHLTSGDPASLLLATGANEAGAAAIDVVVPALNSSFTYYTQGVGVSTGAVTITATAPGYSNGTTTVTVASPALDLINLPATTTTLAASPIGFVRLGVPNVNNTAIQVEQSIRFGGTAVTATVTNDTAAIADLVTTPDTSDQITVTIPVGSARSPSTVATGGFAFDPIAPGITSLSATAPGFTVLPSATVNITINQPNITLNTPGQGTARIGAGLQDVAGGNLQNTSPSPVTVTLTSGDPAVLLLSNNATTAGTPTTQVTIPVGSTGFTYYTHGVVTSATPVQITASATGFNNGTVNATVANPGVDISNLPTTITSIAATDPFFARIGVVNAAGTSLQALQAVRAGNNPVVATFTSSNLSAGNLVTTTDTGTGISVTVPIASSNSPTTVAAGGIGFDPVGGGTTTVSVSIPGFVTTTQATVNVTVSAPNITLFTTGQGTQRLGVHLQDAASGSLQTAAPDTLLVHIVSGDPASLLISPNDSTPGAASADIKVNPGQSSFVYYTQGVGVSTGTVTITASAPGYNNGTTPITVANAALQLSGLPTTSTTFSLEDAFQVAVGVPNAGGTAMVAFQSLRAGETPQTVTITNSNGTVGQLHTTPVTGNAVTVVLSPRQNSTPSSVALGGVAFDPLVAGSTIVAATIPGFTALPAATVNMTVSAPTISMSTPGQGTGFVGSGLQDAASGSFQVAAPGPLTLRIQSSNPAVALVSPNATTPGTAFIDIPIAQGASSFSYVIQGVEDTAGTVQIQATAPGYSTGQVNVQIVKSGVQISGLTTSLATTSTPDAFQLFTGAVNANRTGLAAIQSVRAGGTAITFTVTSSAPSVGVLLTNAFPSGTNSITLTIAPTANSTPSSRAAGGVEFDGIAVGSSTVTATSGLNYIVTTPQNTVNVTVN